MHAFIERHVGALIVCTLVAVSVGGMVEIFPMVFERQASRALPGVEPLPPLALAGRDIYIREGCHVCHTQMVRALQAEAQRYGQYAQAGEDVYERPFLWGSKRTGPDLMRVGGRYSDDWHRVHLLDPRSVVPVSNMPAYPWLFDQQLDAQSIVPRMRALATLGAPYTEEDIARAPAALAGRSEADALIVYLQSLVAVTP